MNTFSIEKVVNPYMAKIFYSYNFSSKMKCILAVALPIT